MLTARDMDLHSEFVTALAGRYDIERELGRGGMAVVYLAHDRKHGRDVALKVLVPELASAMGAERFLREVAITAPLVHPNIVPVLDSGEAAGQLYYVMPFVEGQTLRQRLDRETQLPIDDALAIARQVADGLDHAHAHGVVHRDIKPDNILLLGDHALVADFGLARALTSATSTPLTQGLVLGTPAYMSPEQCTPGRMADARSDIYSLACVLFEMIAGQTPFRGATADVVIGHHLVSTPPSICAERSSCPPHLDDAVAKAMAKVPADRFKTAGAFIDAITAAPPARSSVAHTSHAPTHRRAAGVALAVAVAALAWLGVRTREHGFPLLRSARIDTSRVALLPLDGVPGGGPHEELMYEAFARWQGVALVDPFQVADAVRQRGRIASEDDALAVAKSLGAGRYVRGRVVPIGETSSVRAGLYQVGVREPLQVATVRLAPGGSQAAAAFQFLADSLLLRGATVDDPPAPGARRSLAAVRAFSAGQRALDDWDLSYADSAFDAARVADPGYARAQLWLAQVRAWGRHPADTWKDPARRALALEEQLGEHDRALAHALMLLADGQFASACREYDAVRLRYARDFAAWYGLGQCRTMDRLVLRDPSSVSGWRFRSSWNAGLQAYEQALQLLPSAHRSFRGAAFESLRELLLTDRDQLVSGYSTGPDSARFFARLSMSGDSLILVPYPWQLITSGRPAYPPGFERAVARQREAFRSVASTWASAFPQAAAAKEALALSLEMLGDASAADTLRAARRLTTDPSERVQLGVAEVFVRVKFALPDGTSELAAAWRLGDSLVAGTSLPPAAASRALAAVAELLGRCERAIALARNGALAITSPVSVPRHLVADADELRIRTTLGCQHAGAPTIVSLFNRIERGPVLGDERLMAEAILLSSAAQLSFPVDSQGIRLLAANRNIPRLDVMHRILRGDEAGAREAFARLRSGRGAATPPVETALPEARVMLALGDSAGARDRLRQALGALASSAPRALEQSARPSALVRAAISLAALEHALGDDARASAWTSAVRILWTAAEPAPQAMLRTLRPVPHR